MSTPIDSLTAMSPQARAALKRATDDPREPGLGLRFLEEAAALSDDVLLATSGFGDSSLRILREWQLDPQVPGVSRKVQDRAWELYISLRTNGHQAADALEACYREAEAFERHAKEAR